MRKWAMAAGALIALALPSCAPVAPVVTVTTIWPELPPVPPLPDLDINSVNFSLPGKNSFVALDQPNWYNYVHNMELFRVRETLYQQRIDEINKQRSEWHDLNNQKASHASHN